MVDLVGSILSAISFSLSPVRSRSLGFSLHTRMRVERHDRDQLEKLCRYVARPALSQARLTVRGDGPGRRFCSLWELRKPWRDGARAFVFDPLYPRGDSARAFGRDHAASARASADLPRDAIVSGTPAPASPLRDEVVLRAPSARGNASCEEDASGCTRKTRLLWAELLERVFGVDILRCPRCGGRRHMIAQITDPLAIRKVLGHLGLRTEPLELSLARPPTQMRFA